MCREKTAFLSEFRGFQDRNDLETFAFVASLLLQLFVLADPATHHSLPGVLFTT